MYLGISEEQFNQVQAELIRLEESLPFMYEDKDSWGIVFTQDRIIELKKILKLK